MSNGTFIINPDSVSFSAIREDIETWLESAPDAAKWVDFFNSSTGQTFIDLVASMATMLNYNVVVARRESYLRYAENRSSVIGAAQTLGYSSNRGRNPVIKINVTPTITGVLNKFFPVGSVKDKDLVLLEDTIVNSGVAVDLEVVIGNLKEEEVTATGDAPASFRFTQNGVSEDIRVFLNDTEVPLSSRILDLVNGYFVSQSNPWGSVDIKYINLSTFEYTYNTGDKIKLEWVDHQNTTFIESDLKFDFGTINSYETVSIFQDVEDKESVRINAPLANETQFVIRGRDDYLKIFKFLETTLVDTNQRDITPAVIGIVGVRDDLSIFSDSEKTDLIAAFDRPMGVAPPTIEDPAIRFKDLDVVLTLVSGESGEPETEARTIMSANEMLLEHQISFEDIEAQFEALDFVKIARITIGAETRENNKLYRIGETVQAVSPTDDDIVFEATRIIYHSGTTEPPAPTGFEQHITDNQIIWKSYDPLEAGICDIVTQLPLWAMSTDYVIGDQVRLSTTNDYYLEVIDLINLSASSQEIQRIDFAPAPPDSGTFRIETELGDTGDLAFNASDSDVQTALAGLGFSTDVSGNMTDGFEIKFTGDDANKDQEEFTFDDEGLNEIQCLLPDLIPNGGTWKLRFLGDTTTVLTSSSNAAAVQTALELLPSIGTDNVEVTGGFATKFLIEFVEDLGKQPLADIEVIDNTLISATAVTPAVSTTTDGRPVDAGTNEIQKIGFTTEPTDGSWSITFDGKTTTLLNSSATAADVEDALENLDSIAFGNVSVTGNFADGFDVEFISALGLTNVDMMTVAQNDLSSDQAVTPTISTEQAGGGGFNEVQKIVFDFRPDAGQWRIEFDGEETILLTSGETFQTIETALEDLTNIGAGNVEVSGDFDNGFILTFRGALADTDVAEITIPFNTLTIDQPVTINITEEVQGRPADVGEDEVQRVDFDYVPDAGGWKLDYDGETTGALAFNSAAIDVQNALNGLASLSAVTVSGDYSGGFVITFAGADGKFDHPELTIVDNTLFTSSAPVTFDTCEDAQDGQYPANNLKQGVNPVTITPSTSTEGINPEPDWPGATECP